MQLCFKHTPENFKLTHNSKMPSVTLVDFFCIITTTDCHIQPCFHRIMTCSISTCHMADWWINGLCAWVHMCIHTCMRTYVHVHVCMYVYVTPVTKMKSRSLMLMEKNSYQTYICEQNATSKPNLDRLHVFVWCDFLSKMILHTLTLPVI
jgi:hypothetical protein